MSRRAGRYPSRRRAPRARHRDTSGRRPACRREKGAECRCPPRPERRRRSRRPEPSPRSADRGRQPRSIRRPVPGPDVAGSHHPRTGAVGVDHVQALVRFRIEGHPWVLEAQVPRAGRGGPPRGSGGGRRARSLRWRRRRKGLGFLRGLRRRSRRGARRGRRGGRRRFCEFADRQRGGPSGATVGCVGRVAPRPCRHHRAVHQDHRRHRHDETRPRPHVRHSRPIGRRPPTLEHIRPRPHRPTTGFVDTRRRGAPDLPNAGEGGRDHHRHEPPGRRPVGVNGPSTSVRRTGRSARPYRRRP